MNELLIAINFIQLNDVDHYVTATYIIYLSSDSKKLNEFSFRHFFIH